MTKEVQNTINTLKHYIGDTFDFVEQVHDIWDSKDNIIFIRDKRNRPGYIDWLRQQNFIEDAQDAGGNGVVMVVVKL